MPSGRCLKCLQFGSVHLKVGVMGYMIRVDGSVVDKSGHHHNFFAHLTHRLSEQCSLSWQSGVRLGGAGGHSW